MSYHMGQGILLSVVGLTMQSGAQSYGLQMYSQIQRGAYTLPADKNNDASAHPPSSSDESHSNSYQDTLSLSPADKKPPVNKKTPLPPKRKEQTRSHSPKQSFYNWQS